MLEFKVQILLFVPQMLWQEPAEGKGEKSFSVFAGEGVKEIFQ
ncbi:hypothetical protein [Desulforapulum autotrophicum]|nr:hypothetical protein [Desulforapulum autotrophicum]